MPPTKRVDQSQAAVHNRTKAALRRVGSQAHNQQQSALDRAAGRRRLTQVGRARVSPVDQAATLATRVAIPAANPLTIYSEGRNGEYK